MIVTLGGHHAEVGVYENPAPTEFINISPAVKAQYRYYLYLGRYPG
jgi:hypothetical protein